MFHPPHCYQSVSVQKPLLYIVTASYQESLLTIWLDGLPKCGAFPAEPQGFLQWPPTFTHQWVTAALQVAASPSGSNSEFSVFSTTFQLFELFNNCKLAPVFFFGFFSSLYAASILYSCDMTTDYFNIFSLIHFFYYNFLNWIDPVVKLHSLS